MFVLAFGVTAWDVGVTWGCLSGTGLLVDTGLATDVTKSFEPSAIGIGGGSSAAESAVLACEGSLDLPALGVVDADAFTLLRPLCLVTFSVQLGPLYVRKGIRFDDLIDAGTNAGTKGLSRSSSPIIFEILDEFFFQLKKPLLVGVTTGDAFE